jgi:hypothetical protein
VKREQWDRYSIKRERERERERVNERESKWERESEWERDVEMMKKDRKNKNKLEYWVIVWCIGVVYVS